MAGSVTPFRLAAAFVWLGWRQQINGLRARGRGAWARAAAWGQLAVTAIVALALGAAALGLGVGGWLAGRGLAAGGDDARVALLLVRLVAGGLVVLAPVLAGVRAGQGGLAGLARLRLLPISPAALHALSVVPFLADPWILVTAPGVVALAAGLAAAGPVAAVFGLGAGLLFLATVAALAAAGSFAVTLLLRDRRRAEIVLVSVFLGLVALGFLPGLLAGGSGGGLEVTAPGAGKEPGVSLPLAFERDLPEVPLFPSRAYARAVQAAGLGDPAGALPALAVLAVTALAALAGSRWVWDRLISSPASGSRGRGRPRSEAGTLPGLRGDTSAVAATFVRTTLRTVQGRVVLVLPTMAAVALGVMGEAQGGPFARLAQGPGLLLLAVTVGISGLQNVLLNQFGVGGSGLTLELLLPLPARALVLGRACGGAALALLAVAPALAATALLAGGLDPLMILAAALAAIGVYAFFAPVAAWLSVLFPKPSDLGKLGSQGKPQTVAAFAGFFALILIVAVPGGLGLLGMLAAGPLGAVLAEGAFAAAGLLAAPMLLAAVASTLERGRERVYLTVRGG